jgi:hydroxylamine reductase
MKKITKDTPISEALEINPKAAEILLEAGVGCFSCMFSQVETVEQGLMVHGFEEKEIEEIVEELNKQ